MLALCAAAGCAYHARANREELNGLSDALYKRPGNTIAPGTSGAVRHQLTLEEANGGLCLDGTPPYFYFAKADPAGSRTKEWVISLQDGAWCMDLKACYRRSLTMLGSSDAYEPEAAKLGSWLSGDMDVNPSFHDANRVQVAYCDGASFSSDVAEPQTVVVDGVPRTLYFRGRKVLEAVMSELLKLGLSSAERVLLTGSSSGGIGALLQHVTVQSHLPSTVTVYKVFADAAWFQLRPMADGKEEESPWLNSIRSAFKLHNYLGSVPHGQVESCLSNAPAGEEHRCWFPHFVVPTVKVPVFLAQSGLDSWQLVNVHRDDWACLTQQGKNTMPSTSISKQAYACTDEQKLRLNEFALRVTKDVIGASIGSLGNGAFISPCVQHQFEIGSGATKLPVMRTTANFTGDPHQGWTLSEALNSWWWATPDAALDENLYLPCGKAEMDIGTQVHCNVQCVPGAETTLPAVNGSTAVNGTIETPGGYEYAVAPLGLPHVAFNAPVELCDSQVACELNAPAPEGLAGALPTGVPASGESPIGKVVAAVADAEPVVNAIAPTGVRPALLDRLWQESRRE